MVLYLSAIDQEGKTRDFSCYLNQLEVGFDVLNSIVANGSTLLSATIRDENGEIPLPLQAFDGAPLLDILRELENEWKSVLREPEPQSSAHQQEMIAWAHKLVGWYETRIRSLELTISRTEILLNKTKDPSTGYIKYTGLALHYESLINGYERMLIKTRFLHRLVLDRLYTLYGSEK